MYDPKPRVSKKVRGFYVLSDQDADNSLKLSFLPATLRKYFYSFGY